MTDFLLERILTNTFTFGFELEGFVLEEKEDEFIKKLNDTFGPDGNYHDDCSLSVDSLDEDLLDDNEIFVRYDENGYIIINADGHGFYNRYFSSHSDIEAELGYEWSPVYIKSFEYSTPVMNFTPENIKKTIDFLSKNIGVNRFFFTNSSCGFHHHLSFNGITGEDVAWIIAQLALDSEAREMFSKFNSDENTSYFFVTDYSSDEYLDYLKDAIKNMDFETISRYLNTEKFSLVNNHYNHTLEWRGPRDFLNDENVNTIKKFYSQLWKIVRWMSNAQDKKSIDGISKENFLKGLAKVNKGKPLNNYPHFKYAENHLLSDDSLEKVYEKVINDPNILLALSNDTRICDQVIQYLFNKSNLRRVFDRIPEEKLTQKIIDLTYKYIPYYVFNMASSDAIYRTSYYTFKRLMNTRYNILSDRPLAGVIKQFFDEVDTNKIKDYIYPDDLSFNIRTFLLRDDYVYADKLVPYLNDEDLEWTIDNILNLKYADRNVVPTTFAALEESRPEIFNNSKIKTILAKNMSKYPEVLKYIDNIPFNMVISMIGRAMMNNNEEDVIKKMLDSGKVTASDVERAKSYFTKFYAHDFDSDY